MPTRNVVADVDLLAALAVPASAAVDLVTIPPRGHPVHDL